MQIAEFVSCNCLFPACQSKLSLRLLTGLQVFDLDAFIGLKADELFPVLATGKNPATGLRYLPAAVGVAFVIGLVCAAFSSAGSAVTALTTSVTVDILGADRKQDETTLTRTRHRTHALVCLVMAGLIYAFRAIGNGSVINAVYVVASYTYGPLLGLYVFGGLFTRLQPRDSWIPWICIVSPLLCLVLSQGAPRWFGVEIGYELLLINAAITMIGLAIASIRKETSPTQSK